MIDEGLFVGTAIERHLVEMTYPEKFYHFHIAIWINDEIEHKIKELCKHLRNIWWSDGIGYFVVWDDSKTDRALRYMYYKHDLDIEGLVCKRTGRCRNRKRCKRHH